MALLALVTMFLGTLSLQAQSPNPTCGCVDVTVTLNDTTCTFRLDTNIVRMNGGTSCVGNLSVRVADNNPLNGDIIDCPGTYTYGLFQGANLLCWGRVTAEDKSGPKLVGWLGSCKTGLIGVRNSATTDTLASNGIITTSSSTL